MTVNAQAKRINGAIYTPLDIAVEVTRVAVGFCPSKNIRVLEPSAGDGAFLRALVLNGVAEENITAVDIDENAIEYLRCEHSGSTVIESDFINYALNQDIGQFDLVAGNPPFIKRVSYKSGFKDGLQKLSLATGFPLAEFKNAWAAFVVATANLVGAKGVLALVVPYQLITVKYGRCIQEYLVRNGFSVDIYVSEKKAFSSIEQDAVLLLARRTTKGDEKLRINRVIRLSEIKPLQSRMVNQSDSRRAAIDLKSVLFDDETASLLNKLRTKLNTMNDYCESSPGIVTAANDYFILRTKESTCRELKPWARRILKKGSYLSNGPVFGEDEFLNIASSEPCELIDFHWSMAPELSSKAREFLELGEKMEIHKRYKCRHREPWYRIPIVPASHGFFFKRAHIFPRFCVNDARVLVTDTAYRVTVHEGYEIRDLCFSFYNSITLLFAEIDGRFYGGGVLEVTPSEFRGLPLHFLRATKTEFAEFERAFSKAGALDTSIFRHCDERLRHELQITEEEMSRINTALGAVREHRMRHSRPGGKKGESAELLV